MFLMNQTKPDFSFLTGFWSGFGMIAESSAFGAPVVWEKLSLPFVKKIINSIEDILAFTETILKLNNE